MAALVEPHDAVSLPQPEGCFLPLDGRAGEPVQQEHSGALAAEVERLEAHVSPGDRNPLHAGVSRRFGGSRLSSESAPSGQSASGSTARMKPPIAGPRRKPRSQEFVETAM